eukprot:CAMPEP_0185257528 /NCGR_PEP_ID=MMETSP1359-20130426/6586_1 /TAXON_ID=552665 /ORGANISM="Bigelowiella longifila, Strain CCMP242" /LENGTH=221 /DNA_ID=CAMNT_0027842669 /DNA_START=160 /DNA_END=825 /DNA_ORIENTATION=+
MAERLKKNGNLFFKKKEYAEALKHYVKIFLYINHLNVSDDLKQMVGNRAPKTGSVKGEDVVKLQVVANQNCALCKLNLGDYEYSETFCNKALARNPKAMKAIMIRGRARLRLNNLDGAKQDLEAAQKEFPNSKVIQIDLEYLKRKYKKVEQKQAKLFAGMFDRKPKKQKAKTETERVEDVVSNAIGSEDGDKISSLISQFAGGANSTSSTADQSSSSGEKQ